MKETNLRCKWTTQKTRTIQWYCKDIEFDNNKCSTLNITKLCRLYSVYCRILISSILINYEYSILSISSTSQHSNVQFYGGIPPLSVLTSPFHRVRYV